MRPHEDPEREVCRGCGFPVGACECDSLRDDAPGYGASESDSSTPEEFRDQYVTEAVESRVLDRDGDLLGHVGLLDLDGAALGRAVDVAERLPGPGAVLRSSESSYHVWMLAVDSLDAWQERAAGVDGVDAEHVALSEQRECAVLRLDAKVSVEDGETLKPAPTLRRLVSGHSDRPLSEPHVRVLSEVLGADLSGQPETDCIGHSTERRVYMADIGGR